MEGLGSRTVADWATVPRGNTQRHVNRDILRYLLGQPPGRFDQAGLRWLDIPCGAGEFLGQVQRFFPAAQV